MGENKMKKAITVKEAIEALKKLDGDKFIVFGDEYADYAVSGFKAGTASYNEMTKDDKGNAICGEEKKFDCYTLDYAEGKNGCVDLASVFAD
jgi:hypothetical protein